MLVPILAQPVRGPHREPAGLRGEAAAARDPRGRQAGRVATAARRCAARPRASALTPADMQNSIGSVRRAGPRLPDRRPQVALVGGRALFSLFSLLVITPVVAFYILLDWKRMVAAIDGWVPLDHRDDVRARSRATSTRPSRASSAASRWSACSSALWYAIGSDPGRAQFRLPDRPDRAGCSASCPMSGSLTVLLLSTARRAGAGLARLALVAIDARRGRASASSSKATCSRPTSSAVRRPASGLADVRAARVRLLFGFTGLLMAVPLAAATGVLARFAAAQISRKPALHRRARAGARAVIVEPRIVAPRRRDGASCRCDLGRRAALRPRGFPRRRRSNAAALQTIDALARLAGPRAAAGRARRSPARATSARSGRRGPARRRARPAASRRGARRSRRRRAAADRGRRSRCRAAKPTLFHLLNRSCATSGRSC